SRMYTVALAATEKPGRSASVLGSFVDHASSPPGETFSTLPASSRSQWLSGSGAEVGRASALRHLTSTPGWPRSRLELTQLKDSRRTPVASKAGTLMMSVFGSDAMAP